MPFVLRIADHCEQRVNGFGTTGAEHLAAFFYDSRHHLWLTYQPRGDIGHLHRFRFGGAVACPTSSVDLCAMTRVLEQQARNEGALPLLQGQHGRPEFVLPLRASHQFHPVKSRIDMMRGPGGRLVSLAIASIFSTIVRSR